jgi:hypothetical protein
MKVAQVLRPKEPRNLVIAAFAAVLLLVVFAAASRVTPWSPKRGLGLAFGFFATGIFVLEGLYPTRQPGLGWFRSARTRLQAHVYLGTLGFLGVLLHAGFQWPRGGLGWWLLGVAAWTTLSGAFGVLLQKWVPAVLAEGLGVEPLYERIPARLGELVAAGDALASRSSDVLASFYERDVRPRLGALAPSWAFVLNVRGGRERALEPFARIAAFVEASEKSRVEELREIFTEKLELDAQYSLQRILRYWLALHAPAGGVLAGLVAVHVFAWVWY